MTGRTGRPWTPADFLVVNLVCITINVAIKVAGLRGPVFKAFAVASIVLGVAGAVTGVRFLLASRAARRGRP